VRVRVGRGGEGQGLGQGQRPDHSPHQGHGQKYPWHRDHGGGRLTLPRRRRKSARSETVTLMVLFAPGSQSPADPSWRCTTNLKSYSPPGSARSSDHESPGAQSMPAMSRYQ